MNAKRRKEIESIISTLESAREKISELMEEEENAYENLPESLQETEQGENMQSAIEALEDADCGFDDIINALQEAVSC